MFAGAVVAEIADLRDEGGDSEAVGGLDGVGETLKVFVAHDWIDEADEPGAACGDVQIICSGGGLKGIDVFVPPGPEFDCRDTSFLDGGAGFVDGGAFEDGVDTNGWDEVLIHNGLGLEAVPITCGGIGMGGRRGYFQSETDAGISWKRHRLIYSGGDKPIGLILWVGRDI